MNAFSHSLRPPEENLGDSPGIAVPSEGKLLEWLAVLCVAGIPYHLARNAAGWTIQVAPEMDPVARRAIEDHEDQHRNWPPPETVVETAPFFKGVCAALWGAYLVGLSYVWLGPYRPSDALLRASGAQSQAVRAGEWWRTVTALMVHADVGHLASNLFFLFFFGALVCRRLGAGMGWLMILTAGAAGNWLAVATITRPGVGIGASTACFGALGLVTVTGIRCYRRRALLKLERWRTLWMPLGGGMALLSLAGTAPGTDIMAHLFGFLAGLVLGAAVVSSVPLPTSEGFQRMLLLLTVGLVVLSWWLAWRTAIA